MPNINTSTETILQGLSSFWLRFFADKDTLTHFYSASEQELGQAYLDLLETLLCRSIDTTPVFHREYWVLLTTRTDQLTAIPDPGSGTSKYILTLPTGLTDFEYLQNTIYAPGVLQEKNIDFSISIDATGIGTLMFNSNPFDIHGVGLRSASIKPVVRATGSDGMLSTGSNIFRALSGKFDPLHIGEYITITSGLGLGTYEIIDVNPVFLSGQWYYDCVLDTIFTVDATNAQWQLVTGDVARQVAFWIPDSLYDDKYLGNTYGYFIGQERLSSEVYRSFLKGIYQYYLLGSGLSRVEAALNVSAGVAVVATDGEVVKSLSNDGTNDLVVTDLNTYKLPLGTTKSTLQIGSVLKAFQSLSSIFTVSDYISDPTIWWDIIIPSVFIPSEDADPDRRRVTTRLYELTYGNDLTQFRYGDLNLQYSVDETGLVPSGRPGLFHDFAYTMMNTLFKFNMFFVKVNNQYVPPSWSSDVVSDIISSGRPAYTYLYAAILDNHSETITTTDVLTAFVTPTMTPELLSRIDNTALYGAASLIYGEYYSYTAGGIAVATGTPNTSLGQTPIVFGGADPNILNTIGNMDWPVQIKTI